MFSIIDDNRDKLLHFLTGYFLVSIGLTVFDWIICLIALALIGFTWEFAREEMYGIPICWVDWTANMLGGIMYAIFETLEQYQTANAILNQHLGYPDGRGTERYATDTPTPTTTGKYAMRIRDSLIGVLPSDTEFAGTVEYATSEHGYEHILDKDELKAWITEQGLAEHLDLRKSLESLKLALAEYFAGR